MLQIEMIAMTYLLKLIQSGFCILHELKSTYQMCNQHLKITSHKWLLTRAFIPSCPLTSPENEDSIFEQTDQNGPDLHAPPNHHSTLK